MSHFLDTREARHLPQTPPLAPSACTCRKEQLYLVGCDCGFEYDLLQRRFADMPIGERNRWLRWADSHDWGQGDRAARFEGDEIVVHGAEQDKEGEWSVPAARFDNPRDLRAWAGY